MFHLVAAMARCRGAEAFNRCHLMGVSIFNNETAMKISMPVLKQCCSSFWMLLVLPLGYGGYMAWQEQIYRSVQTLPELAPLSEPAPLAAELFKSEAIATVLGLGTQDSRVPSAEPLQLRASFVSSQGPSQALLADAQSARFYSEGEPLPGGSVLRRIEVDHVVLWRNGREEFLTLKPDNQYVLPVPTSPATNSRPSTLYLRPSAEQL